jgi:activator of HSP90 ATPase
MTQGSLIHQVIQFDASPEAIYDQLLDAENFAAWSGAPAEIDPTPGGAFSLFGGQIEGRMVELVPGARVVQAWRVAGWDPGEYSLTRFEFGPSDTGTTLTFDHTAFPMAAHSDLDAGWHAMYWEPLRAHLAAG